MEASAISHVLESMRRSDQPETGSSSLIVADLAIQTSARDLLFRRSYSSGGTETVTQELGYGWIHNQPARLILPDDPGGMEGSVLFQSVIGNQYLFKIEADGSYTPGPAVLAILTKSTDTYTITDSQKETFSFDAGGRLIAREDAQGHPLDFSYDAEAGFPGSAQTGTHATYKLNTIYAVIKAPNVMSAVDDQEIQYLGRSPGPPL